MSITIQSTDSQEIVQAVMGELSKEKPVEKSAPSEIDGETKEDSETPEKLEATAKAEDQDEENEEGKDEKDHPKGTRRGFKKRIDKLTSKLSAAKQDAEFWRNEALKAKTSTTAEPTQVKKADPTKPKEDDFETHADYIEALTDWKVDKKATEQSVKQKEDDFKNGHQKRVDTHMARVKVFAEKHEDFEEVMDEFDDYVVSPTIEATILDSENGPQLLYALAKNREELDRINALPALAAARELGKFEAKFVTESSTKTTEIKTTKAPKPIKPLGANSSGQTKKSIHDADISQDEYERLRMEQKRAKRA